MELPIYLDHAASTPVAPEVLQAMLPFFTDSPWNAAAIYAGGKEATDAVETARQQVADLIGADADEVFFTSGGTESDNWALKAARMGPTQGRSHILISAIEHAAVIESAEALARAGWDVERVPVGADGCVEPAEVDMRISSRTALVSVMTANNEVGTLQAVEAIADVCRSKRVLFHTDAVQAAAQVPLDVQKLGADMVTISAHKLYGPKGVGALYIRRGTLVGRWMDGGSHERGLRAGTVNVPGVVGIGAACSLLHMRRNEDMSRVAALRDRLVSGVLDRVPECRLSAAESPRLPNFAHFCFRGVEGEAILIGLDAAGIYASAGAACSSRSVTTSHVLRAMGMSDEWARGAVRLTLGRSTTEAQVDYVVDVLAEVVADLRR
ncbi:MAG: cysteine desulfurase [Chthonomonadales bacterium]|nr:cysteine desulfurase [Chthonomonadales bacterium]